jgi:hypothetical protein
MPLAEANAIRLDLRAVAATTVAGLVPQGAAAAQRHWQSWTPFCTAQERSPLLDPEDPAALTLLQVYAHRYRTGELAPSRRRVKSATVEAAVRQVGQAQELLGTSDPRLDPKGKYKLRLLPSTTAWAERHPPRR